MYHTRLTVTCDPLFSEILMAEISQAGFDSFLELGTGFEAYAEADRFDRHQVDEIREKYHQVKPLSFTWDRIEKKNWNEEWENNYKPVVVDEKCIIRAGFHKIEKSYPYSITITPKMSFGTGHHQTTYLMLKAQMELDHKDKMVMDAGCGTAILSIMASKRGAKAITAFDIDEWSVVNGRENIEVNNCHNIEIRQGMISELTFEGNYDIILANINKNILLQELPQYVSYLNPEGFVLLSGFYEKDIPALMERAGQYRLVHVRSGARENWASLLLQLKKQ